MQPVDDQEPDRPSVLRRYGPLAAVLLVLAIVAGVSVVTSGSDEGDDSTDAGVASPAGDLPEGVVTWSMAQEQGLDVTFPDTCDTESGMVAIPFYFRTECLADVEGDNGGETAAGRR